MTDRLYNPHPPLDIIMEVGQEVTKGKSKKCVNPLEDTMQPNDERKLSE